MKTKLKERYGVHRNFAEVEGRSNLVCFRHMANYLINSTWSTKRRDSTEKEARRIVGAASKIIRSDIRNMKFNLNCYPEYEMKSVDEALA